MASLQPENTPAQSYLEEYIGYRLTNTAIIFIALNIAFCGLRICARRFNKAPLGWDDFLVPLGLLFCIGVSVACILVVRNAGVGFHFAAVSPTVIPYFFKTIWIAAPILYSLAVTFPKLAILVLYLKIFLAKWSRIGCYITGAVLVLAAVVNIPTLIWQCSPLDHLWNQYLVPSEKGHCFNGRAHFLYGSLPNIVTDVAMLLLPIETIWKLHTTRNMKIGIFVTFLTGSIGLVTSIIRFTVFFSSENDLTWDSVPLLIWLIIEPGIYLIASCLISCRPLVSYLIYERLITTISSRFSRLRTHYTRKKGDSNSFSGGDKTLQIELQSHDGQSDTVPMVDHRLG